MEAWLGATKIPYITFIVTFGHFCILLLTHAQPAIELNLIVFSFSAFQRWRVWNV